jgi:hypothetical protein
MSRAEGWIQDLRLAIRSLRRTPVFALAAAAILAQHGALSALAILDVFNAGRDNMLATGAAESITGLRVSAQFFEGRLSVEW